MENRDFRADMYAISKADLEFEAIAVLLQSVERKYVQAAKDVMEARASLNAISKLNQARYHDDGIAALCE